MLFSIHLVSNNPKAIEEAIQNIDETAANPSDIEIVFIIDQGDISCLNAVNSFKDKTRLTLRCFESTKIKCFNDVWKPFNESLSVAHPDTYFTALFNDEFRFKTKGWDEILRKYVGYYEDDIFRIRLSRYRFRNYSDFWECVFAPDSLAFYTKKWIDITGVHFHGDSWSQLVSFYLINSRKFDHIQYVRDVAEPFIEFAGEGAGVGLTGLKARAKNIENLDLWFEAVSPEMQKKAKYAAAMLQTHIIMHNPSNDETKVTHNFFSNRKPPVFKDKKISEVTFKDNKNKKIIEFSYENKVIYKINYKINKLNILLINFFRKINYPYYAGGGYEVFRKNIVNMLYTYSRIRKYGDFGYKEFVKTNEPDLFLKHNLKRSWIAVKTAIAALKITWILFLKITFSEKYYRLLRKKLIKNAK